VLGDPAQLPPVKGGGFFTDAEPDVMLTQIHRQAENNPIIRLSEIVRAGGEVAYGTYGESRVIRRDEIEAAMVLEADQVLVGMNRTRRLYNQRIRALGGKTELLPVAGDKLVCLRNDRTKGLINGGLWRVEELGGVRKDFIKMTVRSEDEPGRASAKVAVLKAFFEGTEGELAYPVRRESDEFDYGYALTVHKAQGSQWDSVMAVRREPRLPRTSGAMALYRRYPRRAPVDDRALIICRSGSTREARSPAGPGRATRRAPRPLSSARPCGRAPRPRRSAREGRPA